MARRKSKGRGAAFQVFNVTYEDGSMTSNRRVPAEQLNQSFGEDLLDLALTALTEQDLKIARRSNRPRAKIKTVTPV